MRIVQRTFHLAKQLMGEKRWAEAIPLLELTRDEPRFRVQSLVRIGLCLLFLDQMEKARGYLMWAVPDLGFGEDLELYKSGHYFLARMEEERGNLATAEKHYGEVLVVDYEYKDTLQRLEELQGGAANKTSIE